ncbi:cysteine hydrolase [Roseibium sp.]|uniref:cysteine hydrolase n=1 Tax=Roseibium sp. TaxID=1936156 RepID=UPI0039EE8DAD
MSGLWIGLIAAGLCILAVVLYTLFISRKISTPTRGARIDQSERPNTALVVIDVQEDFTHQTGKNGFDPASRDAALADINRNLAEARASGQDIVFIKHVFRDWWAIMAMKLLAGGVGTPGREGLRLDPVLDVREAPIFEKAIGDAFSNAEFENWLARREIGRLILTGLDACQCVQLTARGGLARGYRVKVREASTLTTTPEKWAGLKGELKLAGAEMS